MKITVNHKYTSRVTDALIDALPENWQYDDYAKRSWSKKRFHRLGNIWGNTRKEVTQKLIDLINIGIYDDEDIDIGLLKKAKYKNGAKCFEIEE